MQSSKSGASFSSVRMIERQMLLANTRDRAIRAANAERAGLRYRFVTISRDPGGLGSEIAQMLGRHLEWLVYDREILDYIAQNSHVRQSLVEQLDEKSQGLVHETIQRFLMMTAGGAFGIAEYYEALVKTLAYLSTRGDAILVGRGANFVTREEGRGLHIRIIASPHIRMQRLAARWRIPPTEARWRMDELDLQRRNFIRRHFKQNVDDPRFYDLTFNTDRMPPQQVVKSILSAMQSAIQETRQETALEDQATTAVAAQGLCTA